MSITEEELARFNAKIQKTDSCWIWTRSLDTHGYGQFGFRGKTRLAHRLAWEINHGPIPVGLFVCHRCDNPRCVNPKHLFLGTNRDNLDDARAKGRLIGKHTRGEAHPKARFTNNQICFIRSAKMTAEALSKQFGCFVSTINKIRQKQTWRHI
jgi:HNH endonuclease